MTISSIGKTGAATAPATSSDSSSALGSLSSNLNNFLTLLMTQLQHQDPTSPMDTNAFTSQLVQYASVEQQMKANTNLTNLITATQSNTILQSSSMVGKQVTATNDHLSLQNGKAQLHFTAPAAEPVTITVTAPSGETVLQTNLSAAAGNNDWAWDGKNTAGKTLADGAYKVMVNNQSGTALATTITATVTGMARSGAAVNAVLGALQTDVGSIQSVLTDAP